MLTLNRVRACFVRLAVFLLAGSISVFAADWKMLPGHVPKIISQLTPLGELPATNELQLAIGLPLRDPAGLENFLAEVYDPASPNFRQFLTPEEFTARFGPTEADYAAVENFARTNGWKITGTHGNRLLLDVAAAVGSIEKALHTGLKFYQHPKEPRKFFAPDVDPTVDARLPIADVSGLSDWMRPHPKIQREKKTARPKSGSGSGGSYFGNDFRNAYVPGTTLTGTGQMVGLFEFDGFFQSDITAYENDAGLANVPLQTVLVDGVSGTPGFSGISGADDEVSLDIELSLAMAPGLNSIVVFEGNTANDILNRMAASNTVRSLSCSWSWGGITNSTTDAIFQQMAAQGQSFFNASGDSDAFTVGAGSSNGVDNVSLGYAPESSPYITQVGGTILSTVDSGAWSAETVWNDNDGTGSSGGVSSYYPIPSWQTNISMTANGGSTKQRNMPDVAMVADNVLVYSENGSTGVFEGTSCAAPLWAGLVALVNQQSAISGGPPIGFVNPAVYTLGKSSAYTNYFYDTTTGNNESSLSPTQYLATTGYDLCTGWGTPNGTNLINALANLSDPLKFFPAGGFSASGAKGGPFTPSPQIFQITNSSANACGWKISFYPSWLTVTPASGSVAALSQTNVTFTINSAATNLSVGTYTTNLWFSNVTTHVLQKRPVALQVFAAMQITPTNDFSASGPFGGPFLLNSSTLSVSNAGAVDLSWSLMNTSSWLAVFPTNGILSAGGTPAAVTLNLAAAASNLTANVYSTTLRFTNLTAQTSQSISATLSIGQNVLLNGGFETGDFSDWTLIGDTSNGTEILNAVVSTNLFTGAANYIHSGNYAAVLGENGYLATLSQTIPTSLGQSYLLSFWLRNPTNQPTQQFEVNWNGATLYNILNPGTFSWTNLLFIVNAGSTTNSVLQFAAENDTGYFALDDISVTPIPTPAFQSMTPVTNNYNFTWDATTGLVYQVQYKTNLLQTNWLNLGAAITAKTNVLSLTDTNALISAPQKFYRLGVQP